MRTWTVVEASKNFDGRSTVFATEREAEEYARAKRRWVRKVYIVQRDMGREVRA